MKLISFYLYTVYNEILHILMLSACLFNSKKTSLSDIKDFLLSNNVVFYFLNNIFNREILSVQN